MGCLSCHSSVFCARPEHPLPTDFYFVPVLSTWSQPTQLCNQPPWAKWLTPVPRATTQRYRHSLWMTAVRRLHAMCCQNRCPPYPFNHFTVGYKEIWMALWCKRPTGPTLSLCGWEPRAYCQLSWHLQSKLHTSFFHERVDVWLLRRVWSNYCSVFIFLLAWALEKRAVSKQHFNTTRVCGSGRVCFIRPPVTLLRCRFGQ